MPNAYIYVDRLKFLLFILISPYSCFFLENFAVG